MTQEQYEEIIERQKTIEAGINKLLSIYMLDSSNEDMNPILTIKEAARLLGVSTGTLMKGCNTEGVPHRRMGKKYLFSKIALLNWLHNINSSYVQEMTANDKSSHLKHDFAENWVRLTINTSAGALEEFDMKQDIQVDESPVLGAKEAAELLGIPRSRLYQLCHIPLLNNIPVGKRGKKYIFSQEELLKWMQTPIYKKVKREYDIGFKKYSDRMNACKARREAERLEKEAKKKKDTKSNQEQNI